MKADYPRPASPKRSGSSVSGRASWYKYYAGYSPAFVGDVLKALRLDEGRVVADPWNGSGTTTQVAHDHGYFAVGFDLNAAMVVVAKARLLGAQIEPSHLALCRNILRKARTFRVKVLEVEPLEMWFTPSSAFHLRAIERAIQFTLVGEDYIQLSEREDLSDLSSLAAFFYVALFRTVRALARGFSTSNPTWMRAPAPQSRLRPTWELIENLYRQEVETMGGELCSLLPIEHPHSEQPNALVALADSRRLPRGQASVDAVITSPPYCTRIDYAVATRLELAALGYSPDMMRSLRERLIGTSTVSQAHIEISPSWGEYCADFLARMAAHPSKASRSYYLKNHLQYFDSLANSLEEIDRVCLKQTPCVLVVQDSYYKELHNDLARVVEEMSGQLGWTLVDRHDYPIGHPRSAVHVHASSYRDQSRATESVLWFRTGASTHSCGKTAGVVLSE